MNSVGIKIKEIRTKKKLTQSDLADGIVNRSYISQIEKGQVQPSIKLLKKFSDRLKCDINEFLEDQETSALVLDVKKALSALEYAVINGDFSTVNEQIIEIEKSQENLHNNEKALLFFCKGKIQEMLFKNTKDAITLYEKSCELYSGANKEERLRSTNHLVNLYIEHNEIHKAFEYLDESYNESIYHKLSGTEKIALLINVGSAHARLGEYYSAIRFLKQAIDSSKRTSIFYQTGRAYMVLGLCQRRILNYEEARKSYEHAVFFFKESEDLLNLAGTYTNLGILNRYDKQIERSIEYLQKAHHLYQHLNDHIGYLNTLYEMSVCYSDNLQYVKVKEYFTLFMKKSKECNHSPQMLKMQVLMADVYISDGNTEEAIGLLEHTIEMTEEVELKQELYERMSKIYLQRDEKTKAFACFEKYLKIGDKKEVIK